MEDTLILSEDGKTLWGVKDKDVMEVVVPDGVVAIGNETFRGCYSLEHIDIPNSVTSIGHRAFCGCSSLESISIPDSVTL